MKTHDQYYQVDELPIVIYSSQFVFFLTKISVDVVSLYVGALHIEESVIGSTRDL